MNIREVFWIPILTGVLCIPAFGAQEKKEEGSRPVEPSPPISPEGTETVPQESAPSSAPTEVTALSGAEGFTVRRFRRLRSYILPSFQISETTDTNFSVSAGPQKYETINSFVGRLALHRAGKHSEVTTDYMGGGWIYNHHSELNNTFHQFGITQTFRVPRWSLLLDDRAAYLPESAFGYGGFGWLGGLGPSLGGAFGTNLASLNPILSLNQSVFTTRASRISNTVVAQVEYTPSPRAAISVAGAYGYLHYLKGGFFDSKNATFITGYTRSLARKDSLGVTYGLSLFRFQHSSFSFDNHFLQVGYGRRISDRLAVQLAAGAQLNVFKRPGLGSTTPPPSWTMNSSLDYRFSRGNLGVNYIRYTTNGGGLFAGARTDLLQIGWNRQLTRYWSGSLNPGYARNKNLAQTTSGGNRFTFETAYAGASLSRALGRHTTVFLSYNFQTQRSNSSPCPVTRCGTSLLRHVFGFGFDWHPREIVID